MCERNVRICIEWRIRLVSIQRLPIALQMKNQRKVFKYLRPIVYLISVVNSAHEEAAQSQTPDRKFCFAEFFLYTSGTGNDVR